MCADYFWTISYRANCKTTLNQHSLHHFHYAIEVSLERIIDLSYCSRVSFDRIMVDRLIPHWAADTHISESVPFC